MTFRHCFSCFFMLSVLFCVHAAAQQAAGEERYPLIPYPAHLQAAAGVFTITTQTTLASPSDFTNETAQLQLLMKEMLGKTLPIPSKNKGNSPAIVLKKNASIGGEEGYRLTISPQGIVIAAAQPVGAFRAVETIRQLMPAVNNNSSIALPCVSIEDEALYHWRGMHLDVSRHFFSMAYLEKYIDLMALYKLNKFHLHLTDDQGWRIEIKRYPKLTEEAAWRTFNNQDSVCIERSAGNPDLAIDPTHIVEHKNGKKMYGGFYTQAQMKDLIAYAAARHIEIVPEIDMPGHMMAAINEYPFLSCTEQSGWGETFSTPICPCKETTFAFAQNVLSEIIALFPGKYIHLGADEVEKSSWTTYAACTALMQKEGLKNVNELQSYFVKRMETFIQSKGKQMIGWDEILEGGVSPTAMVMYWRSWVPDAPVKAAKLGNKVIMTPGNPLYFDAQPDAQSVYNVYHFSVVPKGLTKKEGDNIMGAQANLWTEYIPSEARADYMYMPRMTALAEVLWSGGNRYASYLARLQQHYPLLDAMNVQYRLPDLPGLVEENVFTDSAVLTVQPPMPGMQLRYTLNNTLPTTQSAVLDRPLLINTTTTVQLAAFTGNGSKGDTYTLHYRKEAIHPPVMAANAFPGLTCRYYKSFFKNTAALQNAQPDSTFTIDSIHVPSTITAPSFALQYSGYLRVPQTGIYSFYLTCDDGGILSVAGREVVNNDGLHSAIEKSGQIALENGLQPLHLSFIEGGGGYKLQLLYSLNGSDKLPVPASWLMH